MRFLYAATLITACAAAAPASVQKQKVPFSISEDVDHLMNTDVDAYRTALLAAAYTPFGDDR